MFVTLSEKCTILTVHGENSKLIINIQLCNDAEHIIKVQGVYTSKRPEAAECKLKICTFETISPVSSLPFDADILIYKACKS